MSCQYFCMNGSNGGHREVLYCSAQDRRLKSAEFFLINRFAAAAAVLVDRSDAPVSEQSSRLRDRDINLIAHLHPGQSINAASKMMP